MRLIDYIKREGISQRRFAIRSGLSPASICRLIKGERYPSKETVIRIFTVTKGVVTANDFQKEAQANQQNNVSTV